MMTTRPPVKVAKADLPAKHASLRRRGLRGEDVRSARRTLRTQILSLRRQSRATTRRPRVMLGKVSVGSGVETRDRPHFGAGHSRGAAHGQRRPVADSRAGIEDRQDRDRSRPRRARYRNHRPQWPAKKKIWCSKSDAGWASCWRRDWAPKWFTRARTTRSFRSKPAPRSPTSSAPICSFRSTPTRAATRRPRRGDLLPEFHFVAGSAGSGGARECGLGEIDLRTAGSGEEDRAEGKDRRVARVRRRRAGVAAQRPGGQEPRRFAIAA